MSISSGQSNAAADDFFLSSSQMSDVKGTADFFIKNCGSDGAAITFLRSVIAEIGHAEKPSTSQEQVLPPPSPHLADKPDELMKKRRYEDTAPRPAVAWNKGVPTEVALDDDIEQFFVPADDSDYSLVTFVVMLPNDLRLSSHIIGAKGANVNSIGRQTNTKIQFQTADSVQRGMMRHLFFVGRVKGVISAFQQINRHSHSLMPDLSAVTFIAIPTELCAHVIGKSGLVIKSLQDKSGAQITFQAENEMMTKGPYFGRQITIRGTLKQRLHAILMILRQTLSAKDYPILWRGQQPLPPLLYPLQQQPQNLPQQMNMMYPQNQGQQQGYQNMGGMLDGGMDMGGGAGYGGFDGGFGAPYPSDGSAGGVGVGGRSTHAGAGGMQQGDMGMPAANSGMGMNMGLNMMNMQQQQQQQQQQHGMSNGMGARMQNFGGDMQQAGGPMPPHGGRINRNFGAGGNFNPAPGAGRFQQKNGF